MGQILDLIRLFGLRRLLKTKRHHDKALPILRGYCTTVSLWAMFNTGAMDELARRPDGAGAKDLAAALNLDERILEYVLEYLDCAGVLRSKGNGTYVLGRLGRILMEEPRGAFDLACGYEPVLSELTGLLTGEKKFGRDMTRRGKFIAQGSGKLGAQLPFPVLTHMVVRSGARTVLDLGCGDLEFLYFLCRANPEVRCYGIDVSIDAVNHARQRLKTSPYADRITVEEGDLFEIDRFIERWPDVDVMTACDTFPEHLLGGNDRILSFLTHVHERFPNVAVAIAEFCRQSHDKLRKRPTTFVEHHFWHNITDQVILSADEWRVIFAEAGYGIVDEMVFDIVGHGYFLLK